MTNNNKKCARVMAAMVLTALLSACGGNSENSAQTKAQALTITMIKSVEGVSCNERLEDTKFAADLQAIHAANIVPEKIACKVNIALPKLDECGSLGHWFDLFIDVPNSQMDEAKSVGFEKFVPPQGANYQDIKCLP